MRRGLTAGLLLIISFLLGLAGIILFIGRENTGWFDEFELERGLVLAAWLVAAAGTIWLARLRQSSHRPAFLVSGSALFVIGALGAVIGELILLTGAFRVIKLWAIGFVTLLFLGEALIGVGLLGSRLVPTWVAWTLIVWNVLWLAILLILSREDPYYPGLHFIPLLLAGIPLAGRRQRESMGTIPA